MSDNPFADLIPQEQTQNPFSDLIPDKTSSSIGDFNKITSPSIPRTILDQSLQGVPFLGTFMDEAAGTLGGLGAKLYDKMMQKHLFDDNESVTQEGRDLASQNVKNELKEHPAISIGSQLASGVITGGLAGRTAAGQAIADSIGSGNLPARIAKGAISGASSGAAYGAGAANPGERGEGATKGAELGGAIGAAAPVVASAVNSGIEGAKSAWQGVTSRNADTLDAAGNVLKQNSQNLYQAMKDAGAELNRSGINKVTYSIGKALDDSGLMNQKLHGDTMAIVADLNNDAQQGSLTLEKLDQYRQLLSQAVKANTTKIDGPNPDAMKASVAIDALDEAIDKLTGKNLSKGTPEAIKTLNDARAGWSQYRKFNTISNIIQDADGNGAKIKSGLTKLLNNDKKIAGFNDDEIEALKNAANTTKPEAILKGLGRFGFSPHNVFMPLVGGTAALATVGEPTAIALTTTGTAARQLNHYLAQGKAEQLLNVIERGTNPAERTSVMADILQNRLPNNIAIPMNTALKAELLNK